MAPAIIAVAETAQDISAALEQFLDPVDDQSAEITALMAECLRVSSALRHIDRAIGPFPHHRRYPDISFDLTTVKDSLNYTFDDVHRLFGRLSRVALVPRAEYEHVWDDLCDHFYAESGNPLRRRLEIYRIVIESLEDKLHDGLPRNPNLFEELIVKLERLLDEQHDKFIDDFGVLGVGGRVVSRPASFERRRPRDGYIPPRREEPYPDVHGGRRDPRRDPDVDDRFPRGPQRPPPPPVPDAPGSPTTSSTSNTFSSRSSNLNSVLSSHWLREVFHPNLPSTILEDTGQTSVCLASDMPGCSGRLGERGYVKLFEQPLENGDLLVRLYQRSGDGRSRFLCRTIRPDRSRKDVVLPLTSLVVSRTGPFLKFFDTNYVPPRIWACLKFRSYELMVVFFCAFLALRSEDNKTPFGEITDFEIHKENELFAGIIVDDHYEHGLRLFQEKDTGVIRLQASVQRGEIKRKPIWTAFITHQILSPTWMSKDSSRVIHLAELNRCVFTDEYNPQRTHTGAHELTFIKRSDAREFVSNIETLSEEARRRHG